jgi:hypothetical protein
VSMRERLFKLLKKSPTAIASFRAVKKGVVVSTSVGNSGPAALGTVHNRFLGS